MLPYKSERSVKKLIEGLPYYQDKLFEETVFQRFNDILVKVCLVAASIFARPITRCVGTKQQIS